MPGHFDPTLVSLSFAIAVLASWVALDLSGRVHGQQRRRKQILWLTTGSLSMGTGIWSMHYVGMLAYETSMPTLYDWPTVMLSLVAALAASGVAFLTLTIKRLSWAVTIVSGLVMGGGIASMHYLGMSAMRMPERMTYWWPMVGVSILLAVVISVAALRLTCGLRGREGGWSWQKVGSALLMGLAIPTMHYSGMAAARWTGEASRFSAADMAHAVSLSALNSVSVVVASVLVLALALIFASVDRHVSSFESALHGSRQSYAQLQGHTKRLQSAFRAGGVGIWECDPVTANFFVDPSLRDLYGLAQEDRPIPREEWKARVHPEDVRALDERWTGCLSSGGAVYESEYRIIRPDGETRRVRSVASIMRNAEGVVSRVVGMTWDVTAERHREQEVADQANRFRATLESIGDGVISTDSHGRIIFLNPAARLLTGWTLEEAYGKQLEEVFLVLDPETGEPWTDAIRRCRADEFLHLTGDSTLISKDGTHHRIRKHVALMNAEGAAVVTFQDITARQRMEEELHYAATHDALTGLVNRAAFEKRLRCLCEETRNTGRTHRLCLVDLDRFKIINDTSGHLAGDALLREIANVLRKALNAGDVAARMGGDEFLVLLTDGTPEQTEKRVLAMLQSIANLRLPWQGRLYDVTASCGVVDIHCDSPEPEVLISQADVATFEAKHNGRNQVAVYTDSSASGAHQEMEVVAGLRRSLEQNRFELYAQPIVAIGAKGPATSYELLVRMRDEEGNLIQPGLFVPAAERFGLMGMLDRWVIRAAFEAHSGSGADAAGLRFAVNLSAESLSDASLWEFVSEELARTGVRPGCITFEVTETGLIGNLEQAQSFLTKARAIGCQVALDDFGTGLSSLSYLKQFSLDVIKIDGAFIRTLDSTLDQAIIRSVAEIARSMDASTVAECVEEIGTIEVLRKLGIDAVQGWATGRPVPLEQVLRGLPGRGAEAGQAGMAGVAPGSARPADLALVLVQPDLLGAGISLQSAVI